MPRVRGDKDYISLAKGLITEASPLAFPENSTADELNFVLDKDGLIRRRRRGFQSKRTEQTIAGTDATIENAYYWQAPDLILFVVTTAAPNTTLYIHRNNSSLTLLNSYVLNTTASVTEIAENTNIIFLTTSDSQKPILLEYEELANTIEIYEVDMFVRDFELVDDTLDLTERPTSLDDNHTYNLYNAGWYKDRRYQYLANQPVQDPLTSFNSSLNDVTEAGTYPSNADVISIGVSVNENGITTFRDDEVRNNNLGNTEAPRGHYIYNINSFNRDARIADKTLDGSVSTTLTSVGTVSL